MPDNTTDLSAIYSGNASIYCVYNLSNCIELCIQFKSNTPYRHTIYFHRIKVIHIINKVIHNYSKLST